MFKKIACEKKRHYFFQIQNVVQTNDTYFESALARRTCKNETHFSSRNSKNHITARLRAKSKNDRLKIFVVEFCALF